MISKEQAIRLDYRDEIHFGNCNVLIGENGGVHVTQVRARINGEIKLWVRHPERFQIPIKHGLYESGYLHDRNCGDFHLATECPLVQNTFLRLVTTPVIGDAFDDMALLTGLPQYYMDSRNDEFTRAAAVRRMDYVVGVRPPRTSGAELVKGAVQSVFKETFGGNLEHLLEMFPHLNPDELK